MKKTWRAIKLIGIVFLIILFAFLFVAATLFGGLMIAGALIHYLTGDYIRSICELLLGLASFKFTDSIDKSFHVVTVKGNKIVDEHL